MQKWLTMGDNKKRKQANILKFFTAKENEAGVLVGKKLKTDSEGTAAVKENCVVEIEDENTVVESAPILNE